MSSTTTGEWVMVPREPTEEMTYACRYVLAGDRSGNIAAPIYRAMLAAAPPAPTVSAEPVAWQARYHGEDGWGPWWDCRERDVEAFAKSPRHEVRALGVIAPPPVEASQQQSRPLHSAVSKLLSKYDDFKRRNGRTEDSAEMAELRKIVSDAVAEPVSGDGAKAMPNGAIDHCARQSGALLNATALVEQIDADLHEKLWRGIHDFGERLLETVHKGCDAQQAELSRLTAERDALVKKVEYLNKGIDYWHARNQDAESGERRLTADLAAARAEAEAMREAMFGLMRGANYSGDGSWGRIYCPTEAAMNEAIRALRLDPSQAFDLPLNPNDAAIASQQRSENREGGEG